MGDNVFRFNEYWLVSQLVDEKLAALRVNQSEVCDNFVSQLVPILSTVYATKDAFEEKYFQAKLYVAVGNIILVDRELEMLQVQIRNLGSLYNKASSLAAVDDTPLLLDISALIRGRSLMFKIVAEILAEPFSDVTVKTVEADYYRAINVYERIRAVRAKGMKKFRETQIRRF